MRFLIKKLLRYGGFLWQIIENKFNSNNLFSLSVDITEQCNSKCKICGIWHKKEPINLEEKLFKKRLKESEYLKKVRLFNIGGGEPFLVPDLLLEIVKTIHKYSKYVQIRIVTNGLLPDVIYSVCKEIMEKYSIPLGLKISIDGTGKIYEKIRGVPNGDKLAIETLKKLKSLKRESKKFEKLLSYSIGFTLTKENINQLEPVLEIAKNFEIGFFYKPVLLSSIFNNLNDLKEDNLIDLSKEREKLLNFNEKLLDYIKASRPITERIVYRLFYSYFDKLLRGENVGFKCGALKSMAYLVPNGEILMCLANPIPLGNINEQGFDKIWQNVKRKTYSKKIKNCRCLNPCDTLPSLMVEKFPFYIL